MSLWIAFAFAVGALTAWALMVQKIHRLEKFVSDPLVQRELAIFAHAHAERDRAVKELEAHQELRKSIFGDLDPSSEESIANIPDSVMEQWTASQDMAAAEEQVVAATYHVWHAYELRMLALIAHHGVSTGLRSLLVQSYKPQVSPRR